MIQETCVHFFTFYFSRRPLFTRTCITLNSSMYFVYIYPCVHYEFIYTFLTVRARLMLVFLKANATWFNARGHELCVSIFASFSDLLSHFSHETIMLDAQPETCFLVHACALTHPAQMKPYLLFDMPHRRALHLSGISVFGEVSLIKK